MNTEKKIKGLGVALITPFEENGEVDFPALEKLVNYHLESKTDYLVVLGTTAEVSTLSKEEKTKIVDFVIKIAYGKIPIVVGVGGNNTKELTTRLKNKDLSKVDAILSVVPYYNKPTQEGIYQHYMSLDNVSPVPIIIYNVPGRTGVNMTSETVLRLAKDSKNIIAVKEASGNIEQITEIIKSKPDGFEVISGDDGVTLPILNLGGIGVISVIGNAFPKEYGEMVRLSLLGDNEKATNIHNTFSEFYKLIGIEGNPTGVKAILKQLGFIKNNLRLPLVEMTQENNQRVKEAIDTFRKYC